MKYKVGDELKFKVNGIEAKGTVCYTSKSCRSWRQGVRIKVSEIINDTNKNEWARLEVGNTPWIYLRHDTSLRLIKMKNPKSNKYIANNGSKMKHKLIKI